jgi:large subunit ribosomal protein L27
MAHKKGQGSVKNGRDSLSKRRGVKAFGGQFVTTGSILVTQLGTRFLPGRYVRRARNDTLFALTDGTVYFDQGGRRVNIAPADPECTAIG